MPTERNLKGRHVCFGSWLQAFSCGYWALLGWACREQDVVTDRKWRAKLFAQWQQGSWGLGSRKQGQVIYFKDMPSMTHFLQLDPTSKVSKTCLQPIKLWSHGCLNISMRSEPSWSHQLPKALPLSTTHWDQVFTGAPRWCFRSQT